MGPYARQLRDLILQLHLDRYETVAAVLARLKMDRVSELQARAYQHAWRDDIEQAMLRPNVLAPPPDPEILYAAGRPDFELGTLENGLRFGIRLLDRVRHLVLVGTTGSGKTNTLLVILRAIAEYNRLNPENAISCVIFQRKGVDAALLAQALGWLVVSVNHGLRLSLAPPQGVRPNAWNNVIAEMFSCRAGMIASSVCLSQIMGLILTALNNPPGPRLLGPTFRLCLEVARKAPATVFGGKPEYIAFLCHTLSGVLQASGDLFDAFAGLDLNPLIKAGQSVCIDITEIRPSFLRLFVVDLLTSSVILPRLHAGDRNARRVLLVADEADEDLTMAADADYGASLSPMTMVLKQGREFRVGCALGLSSV